MSMRKEDFVPPFIMQRCENMGMVEGRPRCSEKNFQDMDMAFKHWDAVGFRFVGVPPASSPPTPEFLRIIDKNGIVVRDWMNFHDERSGKAVFYQYDALAGNPIPIIIAAKVAKKVGKEVIKRVEEKKKE